MNEIIRYRKASDVLIISHLRQDARMTLTQMSKQTRIPVSTIFDKIKQFKETGLIKKNTTIVSFERFGYNTKALVFLSTTREERAQLVDNLKNSANVNCLFKVNNGWDLIAEIISPSFKEIEEFLERIEEKVNLTRKEVFYIIEEIKREEFFSNPKQLYLQG